MFPPPVVAVEVAPAEAPPALVEVMIETCTSALRRGVCASAESVESSSGTPATAIVVWSDEEQGVRVEVGVNRDGVPTWVIRRLTFRPSDVRIERWRAAGLTVASLVGELDTRQPDAPGERDASPPETPTPSERRPPPSSPSATSPATPPATPPDPSPAPWLGLSAVVGSGLSGGESVRVGGRLEGGYAPSQAPLYLLASVDHTVSFGGPVGLDVRWTTLGVGAAMLVPASSNVGFGLSAEIITQNVTASLDHPGDSSGNRWDPGVAVGARALFPHSASWAAAAGLDAWRLARATDIRLDGQKVGRVSGWGVGGWVGLRWSPL